MHETVRQAFAVSTGTTAQRMVATGTDFVTLDLSCLFTSGTWDTHGDGTLLYDCIK